MATGYKNPPAFDGTNYEAWKNEIEIWRLVTDLDKKKQALAVTLTLKGQARAKALEIDAEKLNDDDGMAELMTSLDSIFKGDKIDIAYSAYSNFDGYKRESENIVDYIIEFERRHHLCKKHDMTLPDAVLAFKLLDGAGLDKKEKQLVLTAVAAELTFANMKSALKRIFGETKTGDISGDGIKVKEEAALYTNLAGTGGYNGGGRRPYRGQSSNAGRMARSGQRGTNPFDKFGRRSRCAVCGSTFHWARDCEHKTGR